MSKSKFTVKSTRWKTPKHPNPTRMLRFGARSQLICQTTYRMQSRSSRSQVQSICQFPKLANMEIILTAFTFLAEVPESLRRSKVALHEPRDNPTLSNVGGGNPAKNICCMLRCIHMQHFLKSAKIIYIVSISPPC